MKRVLLAAIALCNVAVVAAYALAQGPPHPTREALEGRVRDYYAALAKADYANAWTFFDPTMRRDNPRDKYLKHIGSVFGQIKIVGRPDVWIDDQASAKVTVGRATTRLTILANEGSAVQTASHYTTWVWDQLQPQAPRQWLLLGGPLRADNEFTGVEPPLRDIPSASPTTRPDPKK
jgi:hypothetical protein